MLLRNTDSTPSFWKLAIDPFSCLGVGMHHVFRTNCLKWCLHGKLSLFVCIRHKCYQTKAPGLYLSWTDRFKYDRLVFVRGKIKHSSLLPLELHLIWASAQHKVKEYWSLDTECVEWTVMKAAVRVETVYYRGFALAGESYKGHCTKGFSKEPRLALTLYDQGYMLWFCNWSWM